MNDKKNKDDVILAFDIATTTGWAVMEKGNIIKTGIVKHNNAIQFFREISLVLDTYKPKLVIAAAPTRFFTVIFKHGRLFGLFDLALAQRGLSFWLDVTPKGRNTLPIDSKIKKEVLGKGKASKQEIMNFMGIQQEDEADAAMFATYLHKQLK